MGAQIIAFPARPGEQPRAAPTGSTKSRRDSLTDNEDAHAMVREIVNYLKAAAQMDKSPFTAMGGVMGIAARYGALVSEGANG